MSFIIVVTLSKSAVHIGIFKRDSCPNNVGKDYNSAMTYAHPLPIHSREGVVRKMRGVTSKIKGVMSTNTVGHHID